MSPEYYLRRLVRYETTPHRYNPPEWEPIPLPLPPGISAFTLRGLLAINRKTVCRTIGCLKLYLDRFTALRPLHLIDKDFRFKRHSSQKSILGTPCLQFSEVTPFPVQDIGPPTWVEEQRVLQSFGGLELFQRVQYATQTSHIVWDDMDADQIEYMLGYKVENFYDLSYLDLVGNNEFAEEHHGEP